MYKERGRRTKVIVCRARQSRSRCIDARRTGLREMTQSPLPLLRSARTTFCYPPFSPPVVFHTSPLPHPSASISSMPRSKRPRLAAVSVAILARPEKQQSCVCPCSFIASSTFAASCGFAGSVSLNRRLSIAYSRSLFCSRIPRAFPYRFFFFPSCIRQLYRAIDAHIKRATMLGYVNSRCVVLLDYCSVQKKVSCEKTGEKG